MRYYYIKSISMTNHLIRNGFDLLNVDDDPKNNNYKVFLFEDTLELRQTMQTLKKH